jgi:hypothetical protein
MRIASKTILDQIPIAHIYKYLADKENASKKQNGSTRVGSTTASRKAKSLAIDELVRNIAK